MDRRYNCKAATPWHAVRSEKLRPRTSPSAWRTFDVAQAVAVEPMIAATYAVALEFLKNKPKHELHIDSSPSR